MNEQLKRIREKDYSAIDQKLFQNMTRTDNINSTLSHLSQFQKFLMEQIRNLNQQSKISPHPSLANNISKNLESLKESLVKCSRAINQNDRKSIANLKKTLNSLQVFVKNLQKDINQEVKETCNRVQIQTKESLQKIIALYSKEKTLKTEYLNKCHVLQEQNTRLLQQNLQLKELKQKLKRLQSEQIFPVQTIDSYQTKIISQNEIAEFNAVQSLYTPLKQQTHLININPRFYTDKSWKITKEQAYNEDKQTPSISRNNSHNKLNNISNMSASKQNELLLRKGVRQQRGKSRQKIKLVSMM